MKKTRFQRFMAATTKTAMSLVELDTYADHLEYTKLMIDVELLKIAKKKTAKKTIKPRAKSERVLTGLGLIKRGIIWTGSAIKRFGVFLGEGRNAAYVIMGSIFAYAIIVMILEMF